MKFQHVIGSGGNGCAALYEKVEQVPTVQGQSSDSLPPPKRTSIVVKAPNIDVKFFQYKNPQDFEDKVAIVTEQLKKQRFYATREYELNKLVYNAN